MRISEKQIRQLMTIATSVMGHSCYSHTKYAEHIATLIDDIDTQQSEKLIEIEDPE